MPGAAYEAVRKLGHDRLKTKNEKGEPSKDGMRLLLDTLKENRASEVPARVSELFLKAFYDPGIWRKPAETMQQYIARREQDFQHEEVLPKSSVPEQVCAMMLMTFAGRAPRSIYLAVLSSCNNEYDFKKLSHALRIQFPQQYWEVCAQARPTWMGTWPTWSCYVCFLRGKWKSGGGRGGKNYALATAAAAADDDDDGDDDDPEASEPYDMETVYEAADEPEPSNYDGSPDDYNYSDDETLDTLFQKLGSDDDPQVAEALATIIQNKSKKKIIGSSSTASHESGTKSFPCRAQRWNVFWGKRS